MSEDRRDRRIAPEVKARFLAMDDAALGALRTATADPEVMRRAEEVFRAYRLGLPPT